LRIAQFGSDQRSNLILGKGIDSEFGCRYPKHFWGITKPYAISFG
jgi:hypothetical protein